MFCDCYDYMETRPKVRASKQASNVNLLTQAKRTSIVWQTSEVLPVKHNPCLSVWPSHKMSFKEAFFACYKENMFLKLDKSNMCLSSNFYRGSQKHKQLLDKSRLTNEKYIEQKPKESTIKTPTTSAPTN